MPSGCETTYKDSEKRRIQATSPYSCVSLRKNVGWSCRKSCTSLSIKCPRGLDGDSGLEAIAEVGKIVSVKLRLFYSLDAISYTKRSYRYAGIVFQLQVFQVIPFSAFAIKSIRDVL
jgi:hypothetical protein